MTKTKCPEGKKIIKKSLEGELFHEVEKLGNKEYAHIGFRDKNDKFGEALEYFVPEIGMTRKAKITIEVYD